MKLKQLMAGATIAGALGAAALGAGAGAPPAAPGPQPGGHGVPAVSHAGPAPQEPGGGHGPGGPGGAGGPGGPGPGGPGRQGGPGDRATTDPAGPGARVTTDPVGLVDRVTTDPADRAAQVTTDPAGPDSTDLVDRAVPERGTAMTTAATSTALRGETDPHPGVLASRRDRHGTGHFRRPVDRGTTGRSTAGATRKRPPGTHSSTSSASTSSEFGSRCKDSPHQTPAPPIGGAGVAHLPVVVPIRPITVCQQHGAPWATMRRIPEMLPKSSVTLGKWRRCARCNQRAP